MSQSDLAWADSLRTLASGVSIAALMLVRSPTPTLAKSTTRPDSTLTMREGPWEGPLTGFIHYGSGTGIATAFLETSRDRDASGRTPSETATTTNAAQELVDASGLPVAMLARIAGVSRASFHKWLRGEGMMLHHRALLRDLIDPLGRLRSILGASLPSFMRTMGPAGSPVDLLKRGDVDTVLGLALLPPKTSHVQVDSGNVEVPGITLEWAGVPESLGWNTHPRDVEEHLDLFDELFQIADQSADAPRTWHEDLEEFRVHVIYGA